MTYTQLFAAPGLSLGTFECCGGAPPADEEAVCDQIVVVRRGAFARHGTYSATLDPLRVLFLRRGERYCIEHPVPGGDSCTVISLGRGVSGRIGFSAAARDGGAMLGPRDHWAHWRLFGQARCGVPDARLYSRHLLRFAGGVLRTAAKTDPASRRPRQQAAVARILQSLNAGYSGRVDLGALSELSHYSPHHLCRVFRRHTGQSIHAYLTAIRLRSALAALAEGVGSLTRIAAQTGFSTPSHFAAAFRRSYGVTPSRARALLRPPA